MGPSRNLVVGAELCFRSGVCLTELELDRLEIWFPVQICVFCPGLANWRWNLAGRCRAVFSVRGLLYLFIFFVVRARPSLVKGAW